MAVTLQVDGDGVARKAPEGPSCIEGWDVLYPKPLQNAEVIRRGRVLPPEYGLACTVHRAYRSVGRRLLDERDLRAGPRGEWCRGCGEERPVATDDRPLAPPRLYSRLCDELDAAERGGMRAEPVERTTIERQRDPRAVRAVLERCGGICENPECGGMPADVTARGEPILEVDHVEDLGLNGPDHPRNMIALCPNCHAVKTRGSRRAELRELFRGVAARAHGAALGR
ncbi:HNH endonuclease signature motif containing protein [Streptomyces sp. NPDC053755]|uniref:HNH endonuclease signature motif containing protein n=1 Tax=Streptomyces sp. NPDC053755 TaxID=3155815 RepID=UPI0034264CF6